MILLSAIKQKKIPGESLKISALLKQIVYCFDPRAEIILFGSRARADADSESDWDFLILTEKTNTDELLKNLIPKVRTEVESVYLISVSLLVKNRKVWENEYSVTNIYASIAQEGIPV